MDEPEIKGSTKVTLEYIKRDISDIKDDIKDLKGQYVTQDQNALTLDRLGRIEKIVYGLVGLVLTGVAVGILNLVVRR